MLTRTSSARVRLGGVAVAAVALLGSLAVTATPAVAGTTTTTGASTASTAPAGSTGSPDGVVSIRLVTVGSPGNPSVGVVSTFGGPKGEFIVPPPGGGIYKSCADAPAGPPNCITSGSVADEYQIGEVETTVEQYVTFLNVADPAGVGRHELYHDYMNPDVWPQYGSVRLDTGAARGQHYSVAYPEWANKPFNFANFLRSARFANSLFNGKVLSKEEATDDGFAVTTVKVRLSPKTEKGMYDLTNPATERTASTGFVIPSYDEWMKAAYYDPNGGGTYSYWQYPTGPTDPPTASALDPGTGDVVNASTQPLATYNPTASNNPPGFDPGIGSTSSWCPSQVGAAECASVNPIHLPPGVPYPSVYLGNVSTVGQTRSRSPWGTLDMGGNVVEWQDTIVTAPPGFTAPRTWRRMHGGVANAAAYQMLISAIGFQPQDQILLDKAYPWFGFRVGFIGNP